MLKSAILWHSGVPLIHSMATNFTPSPVVLISLAMHPVTAWWQRARVLVLVFPKVDLCGM